MKTCKRILAILLTAALLLGGLMIGAAAVDEGKAPLKIEIIPDKDSYRSFFSSPQVLITVTNISDMNINNISALVIDAPSYCGGNRAKEAVSLEPGESFTFTYITFFGVLAPFPGWILLDLFSYCFYFLFNGMPDDWGLVFDFDDGRSSIDESNVIFRNSMLLPYNYPITVQVWYEEPLPYGVTP